ncbi:DoxX family protein [Chitinophaga sp. SYP-B3965]|uniref:DoxX family protein n=1 Tax=Chitinophaga sp. SYP-B3965 TaxID=2663120 RepID=UPI0012999F13|nr:DoxX family protein [Chitinophaga sp. SYP-B3965]MRG47993.1 DoxX family protein [Chitinophaga sp. SYP-B3965]
MPEHHHTTPAVEWNNREKIFFRFFFIYFLLQVVPLDPKYFLSVNWLDLHYGDIFNIAHYNPQFFSGYASWGFIALLALAGTAIWTYIDRNKRISYDHLYYWIRVAVRYRLAIALFAYGFLKFYPLQAPYPSLSNLNTYYGDYTRWKLFSLSLGIVPNYQSFLGLVEIITGGLLLYRKTASVGAFIVLIFTGNVFMSNIAYEGGEQVYSLYLITLALFLLSFDIQRLAQLLILQKPVFPNRFHVTLTKSWQRYSRIALKSLVIFLFVLAYAFKLSMSQTYQFPATAGLADAAGIYNVAEFSRNKDTIPYSKTDPLRWQDVVFEKWATISIRSNRPVIIDSNNLERVTAGEDDKIYELEGTTGRHYYSYDVDTLKQVLTLRNKNKHYQGEQLVLHYNRLNDSKLVLSNDSLYVVLDKIPKKWLLEEVAREGRRKSIKL